MSLTISDLAGTLQEFFSTAGGIIFKKVSSATTPATDLVKLYFKTDGNFYSQDDTGTETRIATGDVAPNIDHLENNQSIIAWDVYSDDKTFDDVGVNDFENTDGIDTDLSSNQIYDAGNDWWRASVLVTCAWQASEINPSACYTVVKLEAQESYTLGTDLRAYASTIDGGLWEEFEEIEIFREIGNTDFIRGDISIMSVMGGQTMRLKIENDGKDLPIAAVSLGLRY